MCEVEWPVETSLLTTYVYYHNHLRHRCGCYIPRMEENRAGGESVEAERALGSYFAWGEGCNVYIHNHFSICFIKLLSIGQMAQKPKGSYTQRPKISKTQKLKEVHFQRPEVQKPERTESQTLKNPRTQKPKSPNVGNQKAKKRVSKN